ncbi:HpcH/HpaI aldolase/citrate lyase family protein [Deinococcus oregonensis]|uniref:HpcH/HpaI aldolase/citrate lyase family protein n=1 Tax=Deinococcus oregonensis TaxID=1805970 RepID=A0ABV6AYI2_9DEIO
MNPALTRPRSVLFAPGNRADLMAKLPRSNPDAVVLDLEDAVPSTLEAKTGARIITRDAARDLVAAHPRLNVFVRINAPHSPYFEDDLHALTPELAGVVVPKLESGAGTQAVADALAAQGLSLPIMAGLETALGVWHAQEIMAVPAVAWAYFGAEDYTTDLGGTRLSEPSQTPNLEVLYARSRVALAARVAGVPALDIVVTRLNDDAAFLVDAAQGRALGYAGKLCIHPAQVALCHGIFGPTPADTARARRLLDAAHAAAEAGHGVLTFEGQMVDEPMLAKARALIAQAEAAQQEAPRE